MNKLISTAMMALALAAMLGVGPISALARGGSGGGGGGWGGGGDWHGGGDRFGGYGYGGYGGIGVYVDPYGWGYPDYGYPYGYPPDIYPDQYSDLSGPPPQAPPTGPAPQSFWYFCRSANAYYPYVSSCPEAWQQVPTTPPSQQNSAAPASSMSIPSRDEAMQARRRFAQWSLDSCVATTIKRTVGPRPCFARLALLPASGSDG